MQRKPATKRQLELTQTLISYDDPKLDDAEVGIVAQEERKARRGQDYDAHFLKMATKAGRQVAAFYHFDTPILPGAQDGAWYIPSSSKGDTADCWLASEVTCACQYGKNKSDVCHHMIIVQNLNAAVQALPYGSKDERPIRNTFRRPFELTAGATRKS